MRRIFDRNIKSSYALLYPGMGGMGMSNCLVFWKARVSYVLPLELETILCPHGHYGYNIFSIFNFA